MDRTPEIVVTGRAVVACRPDRAVVGLTVAHLAPTAPEALGEVTRRAEVLAARLDDLGIDATDRVSTGVRVAEQRAWRPREEREVSEGFRATATLSVSVRDIGVLGRLLADAVATAGAELQGPTWVVDAANPGRIAAYAEAARDARLRAEAYAQALGHALAGVVRIEEGEPVGAPVTMPRPVMLRAAAAEAAPVPVESGEVDVHATVTVTFTLG